MGSTASLTHSHYKDANAINAVVTAKDINASNASLLETLIVSAKLDRQCVGKVIVARIKLLGVRFSAGEFSRIADAAEAVGITPTAWVRHQALSTLNGKPDPPARFHAPPAAKPPAKLTRTAGTRFTEEQFEAIDAHSRACGLTVTAFIRKLVLGFKPLARRPESRSAIVAVNRVGNNLNQLVHLANSGIILAPELLHVLREVHAANRALQEKLLRADSGDDPEPADAGDEGEPTD